MVEVIYEAIGETGRKGSYGVGVHAMTLNFLGVSSRALYLMPRYMKNKPVDVLIRSGLTAEEINDDTLRRCQDDKCVYGVIELFERVATKPL